LATLSGTLRCVVSFQSNITLKAWALHPISSPCNNATKKTKGSEPESPSFQYGGKW
jgi:hypothetical protein